MTRRGSVFIRLTAAGACAVLIASARPSGAAETVSVDLNGGSRIVIDGFGGFGCMTAWWNPAPFYNQKFLDLVVDSLGATLGRTELYPTPDQEDMYTKQVPYLKAMKDKAAASRENYRFLVSIWTPPNRMKDGSGNFIQDSGAAYGKYLVNYCKRFKADVGVDLLALSPQNEPALGTSYNSCTYYPSEYAQMFMPVAHAFAGAGIPTVLHYADNVPWGGCDWQGQVVSAVCKDRIADSVGAIMSMHYNSDDPTYFDIAQKLAAGTDGTYRTVNVGKKSRLWNTEFGGCFDSWQENKNDESGTPTGGAFTMASNLFDCLRHDFTAVVYWQYCEPPHTDGPASDHYSMFYVVNGVPTPGPLFRVAQTVYRHLRPGAVKVGCTSSNANIWAVAYKHDAQGTVTVILLNKTGSGQSVTVQGAGLPASMIVYQTSPVQNHMKVGTIAPGGSVNLPPSSITALCNAPQTGLVASPGLPVPDRPAISGGLRRYGVDGRRVPSPAVRTAHALFIQVGVDGTARVNVPQRMP